MEDISNKDTEIEKENKTKQQLREIEEKQKLILTRDRMLQITRKEMFIRKKLFIHLSHLLEYL